MILPRPERNGRYSSYRLGPNRGLLTVRRKEQSSWALQTYMGYAYESYSTIPSSVSEEDGGREEEVPLGWSGDVNTNVQVSSPDRQILQSLESGRVTWLTVVVQVCGFVSRKKNPKLTLVLFGRRLGISRCVSEERWTAFKVCENFLVQMAMQSGGELQSYRAELMVAEPGAPHPGLDKTVELKTNKVIRNPRQEAVFHKYAKPSFNKRVTHADEAENC
jgi:hypothetical protein